MLPKAILIPKSDPRHTGYAGRFLTPQDVRVLHPGPVRLTNPIHELTRKERR